MTTSRYNGQSKYATPDCPTCPYYLAGPRAQRIRARVAFPRGMRLPSPLRFCAWGVAIKVLDGGIPRHCELTDKPGPGWPNWEAMLSAPLEACRSGAPTAATLWRRPTGASKAQPPSVPEESPRD
jgi:hypothetical protein